MLSPEARRHRQALIDAQLEELAGPAPAHEAGNEMHRRKLCHEAAQLLVDPGYKTLLAHMRHVACSTLEPQPDLGTFNGGTVSEHAVFRAGASQMFRMIGRLAMEAPNELVD